MAVIETLSVAITARTKGFTKGLQGVEKRLNAFASRASSLGTTALVGLGTAAAAAAAGITALARPQFDAIDKTAKLADALGLSTEALVGFQHAADLSGVSQEALGKGLQRFEKTIADAGAGLSTAKRALDNLGLDSTRLVALSVDQALALVADRLPNMASSFQRTQTALDLFGRSGLGMVNMLADGSEGLRKAQEEAERLGLTFNRIDARQVEAANDAVSRLRSAFAGVGRTIAIETAPFIDALSTKLVESGMVGEGMGKAIVDAIERITLKAAGLINVVQFLSSAWNSFRGVVESVASFVLKALGKLGMMIGKVVDLIPGMTVKWDEFQATIDLGEAFGTAAEKSFEKAGESLFKALNTDRAPQIKSFLDGIRDRAREAAQGVSQAMTMADASASGTRKTDAFGARAIDLGSVFVGALNSSKRQEQSTKDTGIHSRLDRTNSLLARMVGGSVAVTA